MPDFIGRKQQLDELESLYNKPGFKTCAIYGRRQVGKTTLLLRFCSNKRALFLSCIQGLPNEKLHYLSKAIRMFTGEKDGPDYEYIQDAIDDIIKICHQERTVVVLDEYPYLIDGFPSVSSILQHAIDIGLRDTDSMLILCGSSVSLMTREIDDSNRPLYKRIRNRLVIPPLSYEECTHFHPNMSDLDLVKLYLTIGGMPGYHEDGETSTYREFVIRHFLDLGADLSRENQNIMNAEFGGRDAYQSIINAISNGETTQKGIASRLNIPRSTCYRILEELLDMGVIGLQNSMLGASKWPSYRVMDPILVFCQDIVKKREAMPLRSGEEAFDILESDIATFLGLRFEWMCADFVSNNLNVIDIGKWWGKDAEGTTREIDVVATVGEDDLRYNLFCECKFTRRPVGRGVLNDLVRTSSIPRTDLPARYMLFSISGFDASMDEAPNVQLVDLEVLIGKKSMSDQ